MHTKKLAYFLVAAVLAACADSTAPKSFMGAATRDAAAAPTGLVVTSPSIGTVVATWPDAPGAKSYNVKLGDIGVHHVAEADLVDGVGTTSWSGVPAGTYSVCIKVEGVGSPFGDDCPSVTVRGALIPQAITFDPIADHTYGDAPFSVSATGGGSGNPVTFVATGSCNLDESNALTITAAGTCTVVASQGGNDDYAPAPSVSRTFTINPAPLTVTLGNVRRTYGESNPGCAYSVSGTVLGESVSGSCTWDATPTSAVSGPTYPSGNASFSCVAADTTACAMSNYAFTTPVAQLTVDAYRCVGFTQPVSLMPSTQSPQKVGSSIPAKFTCVDDNGLPILNATAVFTAQKGSPTGAVVTSDSFRLADATIGQYIYNWKTTGVTSSGSYYYLTAALNDGVTRITGYVVMK